MSAHHVYDNAPLGSLIRYSDDTPKPPARFNKKLAAWQNRNGVARLVKKEPQRDRPTYVVARQHHPPRGRFRQRWCCAGDSSAYAFRR